jgi:hypothetical protein
MNEGGKMSSIAQAHATKSRRLAVMALLAAMLFAAGCYYYGPAPAYGPGPTSFDRSWDAARGAAYDEGVRLTGEDRSRGLITGARGDQDVTINIFTQADGSVRVEFNARGPQGANSDLASRLSRAYDRRMGR